MRWQWQPDRSIVRLSVVLLCVIAGSFVGTLTGIWLAFACLGDVETPVDWFVVAVVACAFGSVGCRLPCVLDELFERWVTAYRARRRGFRCDQCDYNLTGNVSGVCPECGTPIEGARRLDGDGLTNE